MKRMLLLLGVAAAALCLAACSAQQESKSSEGMESSEESGIAQQESQIQSAAMSACPQDLSLVAFDKDGLGDLGYQFALSEAQREELYALLRPEQWSLAENLPAVDVGRGGVALNQDGSHMIFVGPWEEQSLVMVWEQEEKTIYFAPASVAEQMEEFLAPFQEQKQALQQGGSAAEPNESDPDDALRQQVLEMGYSQAQLEQIERLWPLKLFLQDEGLQEEFARQCQMIDRWLELTGEQLAAQAYNCKGTSADGTKSIYVLTDPEAMLSPMYYIWHNGQTGESRFLTSLPVNDLSVQNKTDDAILLYDRTRIQAFDRNTGEALADYGPQFDFGQTLSDGCEYPILGIGYDEAAGCYVVAYTDWTQRDSDSQTCRLKLEVFDHDGAFLRRVDTGEDVVCLYKNFYQYAEQISFPQQGQVFLRFAAGSETKEIQCAYLEEK